MKKNPAPVGEEDGRIIPLFSEAEMYLSLASLYGADQRVEAFFGVETYQEVAQWHNCTHGE